MAERKRIGELLIDKGAITQEQLDDALKLQQRDGGRLGVILVQQGFVESRVLADILAEQTAMTIDRLKSEKNSG